MIDDDVELCQEMAEVLTDEGYSVETVADGSLGIDRLGAGSYDLVILDYRMPSSDGIEVLRFIRKNGIDSKIFVISGRPFIEKLVKKENLSKQVTLIINKPFSIKSLLDNIKKL